MQHASRQRCCSGVADLQNSFYIAHYSNSHQGMHMQKLLVMSGKRGAQGSRN